MNSSIATLVVYLFFGVFGIQRSNGRVFTKYPYLVSLKLQEESQHLSSGSLLDFKWVLTAANPIDEYLTIPEYLIVSRLNQTREVDKIYRSNKFNSRTFEHDIALVLLREPFSKTRFIDICKIPVFTMDLEMKYKCAEVEVIGIKNSSLINAAYKVSANENCKQKLLYDPVEISFCAQTEERATCVSDRGGPAICEGFVFGIVSYGCKSGVFTRVDKHLKFIFEIMGPSSLLKTYEEEDDKRDRHKLILSITLSTVILICVLIILLCSLGPADKLKCFIVPR